MNRSVDLEFVIRPDSLDQARGRGRSVVGPIWVRAGGVDFPAAGWSDFPAVLLGGWLTELEDVAARGSGSAILEFMDGPYQLCVERRAELDDTRWRLTLVKEGTGVAELEITDLAQVIMSVRTTATRLVAACRQRGWNSTDVRYLAGKTGG